MNLTETLALGALLVSFFVIGIKIYNITKQGKFYAPIWVLVGIAVYVMSWLISLVTFLLNWGLPDTDVIVIYQVLFVINSFFFVVVALLTLVEVLFLLGSLNPYFEIK